jgi:hypothetical protein
MWRIKTTILLVLGMVSLRCSPSKEQAILNKHKQSLGDIAKIHCIIAKAACDGPEGKYSTLTESAMDQPYLFFEQEYTYKSPFTALVNSYDEGYGLDSTYQNAGHISTAMIGVVKVHEFHKLIIALDQRYSDFKFTKDTSYFSLQSSEILANDPLGLPVKLYFDKKEGHLNGFTQRNPYKKSELIQIYFSDWYTHQGGTLFDKVEIHQGKKGKYSFNYETVVFNDPTFKKKKI